MNRVWAWLTKPAFTEYRTGWPEDLGERKTTRLEVILTIAGAVAIGYFLLPWAIGAIA